MKAKIYIDVKLFASSMNAITADRNIMPFVGPHRISTLTKCEEIISSMNKVKADRCIHAFGPSS